VLSLASILFHLITSCPVGLPDLLKSRPHHPTNRTLQPPPQTLFLLIANSNQTATHFCLVRLIAISRKSYAWSSLHCYLWSLLNPLKPPLPVFLPLAPTYGRASHSCREGSCLRSINILTLASSCTLSSRQREPYLGPSISPHEAFLLVKSPSKNHTVHITHRPPCRR
jgi:hypothetical protein